MFGSTKEHIDKLPFYSEMPLCPLKYHGYRQTKENINRVIEEIQYELAAYPDNADILLDHILKLKTLKPIH